ncbi:MAG: hypothetical protein EOP21_03355, partial [Hyphomicrobiales bacterium]
MGEIGMADLNLLVELTLCAPVWPNQPGGCMMRIIAAISLMGLLAPVPVLAESVIRAAVLR